MGLKSPRAHLLLLITVVLFSAIASRASKLNSGTFLSPELVLTPGSVTNKLHYNIDFPTGHIGIKGFHVEPVDEFGNPSPLHQTYVHHWDLRRYIVPKGSSSEVTPENDNSAKFIRNSGVCQGQKLAQYYGSGSETRKTSTYLPDPYAIEVGNPEEGYEERWLLDIHVIDTRGVVDKLGCTECVCELYNVTMGGGYKGGYDCCVDGAQCRLQEGFQGPKTTSYLRYTVRWVDWEDGLFLPLKVFLVDISDTGIRDMTETSGCQGEYQIEPCSNGDDSCIDVNRFHFTLPATGYVIYVLAHLHSGATGSNLYRKDGEVLCNSAPIYGTGSEVGNEAGYIVGMTTCYPEPGSMKLTAGEELILEANYTSSSTRGHFGVMGLAYIFMADQLPAPTMSATTLLHRSISATHHGFDEWSAESWTIPALAGLAIVALVAGFSIWVKRPSETEDGYQVLIA